MSSDGTKVPELEPGTSVGEYRVKGKIGQGGMGQVYAGEQPLIGKQVAIKVLSSDLLQDPSIAQRMLEEAKAVNLIRHPNIIDIFSFGTLADGRPYFVMELLEGESLETALARGTISRSDLVSLVEQLCQTMAAAHEAGFVHRDLKPENLWLLRRPRQPLFLKILDFGIAKNLRSLAPGLTADGQVLGTAHYMAPEQVLARPVDARTDIYTVGVILYRMLAGVLPFDDPNVYSVVTKHVTEAPKPLSQHRSLPADLERIVMRCLAKDPARRPQTVSDLWNELRPVLEAWKKADANGPGTALACRPASDSGPPSGTTSRKTIQPVEHSGRAGQGAGAHRRPFFGAGVAVALLVVGGVVLQISKRAPPTSARSPTLSAGTARDAATTPLPVVIAGPALAPKGLAAEAKDAGPASLGSPPSPIGHPRRTHKSMSHDDNASPIRL